MPTAEPGTGPLPAEFRYALADRQVTEVPRYSGAPCRLFLLHHRQRPDLVLKIGHHLRREADRLAWLSRQPLGFAVPRPVGFAVHDSMDHLLMTRIPGRDAGDRYALADSEAVVSGVAEALRQIHAIPTDTCPFDSSVEALLVLAEQRVRAGMLRPGQFPPCYRDRTPDQLLRHLHDTVPEPGAPTVTHGDPSLVNVMVDNGSVTGVLDVGLLGVSDPWRDLAIAVRSVTRNLGPGWTAPFLRAYGTPSDQRRLDFFQLLDQFVMNLPAQRPMPHS